jgi:hypothetical protein
VARPEAIDKTYFRVVKVHTFAGGQPAGRLGLHDD